MIESIGNWAMIDSVTLIVINIIVYDGNSGWITPDGITMREVTGDDYCAIGSTYDPITQKFSSPSPPLQS